MFERVLEISKKNPRGVAAHGGVGLQRACERDLETEERISEKTSAQKERVAAFDAQARRVDLPEAHRPTQPPDRHDAISLDGHVAHAYVSRNDGGPAFERAALDAAARNTRPAAVAAQR